MTVPLNSLFAVVYGNKLDMNKMAHMPRSVGGVNFVGRSSQRHGVTGAVRLIEDTPPFPPGSITVALGGTKLLTSFVQLAPFYTAQNVAVLQPLEPMTMAEKLFICLCIQHNRFRYSAFGREANRTLRTLPVPGRKEFPKWLQEARIESIEQDLSSKAQADVGVSMQPQNWTTFKLADLFDIRKGVRLTQAQMEPGSTPFISATDSNNGIRQRISARPLHTAGLITVSYNGSVAEAFYQPEPFFASDDINVLYHRFDMDEFIALFICTIIRREKYRFNYGRKWNLERMKESQISLPVLSDGLPDWNHMRAIIQGLPYSASLASRTALAAV